MVQLRSILLPPTPGQNNSDRLAQEPTVLDQALVYEHRELVLV